MPGLESFCVCTAIGLASIYLLQVSWFVAWMSIDEERVENKRNGIVPCIIHNEFQPVNCLNFDLGAVVLKLYTKLLSSTIFKILILISTVAFLGVGAWGWSKMKQKFDKGFFSRNEGFKAGIGKDLVKNDEQITF